MAKYSDHHLDAIRYFFMALEYEFQESVRRAREYQGMWLYWEPKRKS